MEYSFVIKGRLSSLNEYQLTCRNNKFAGARLKKVEQERCYWSIKGNQALRGVTITQPVAIRYMFFEPNKRRDHDNVSSFAHKVIQDALVQSGLLEDDGWNEIVGYTDLFFTDKRSPRIEVTLTEVGNERSQVD